MIQSLRNRLILSHILPLLIVLPLMGIFLLYALETRYFLPTLTRNLVDDAILVGRIAGNQPDLWSDPARLQSFLNQLNPSLKTPIVLLGTDGQVLAANREDLRAGGSIAGSPWIQSVLAGDIITENHFSAEYNAELIDVLAPVTGPNGNVLGIVRVPYHFATVFDEILAFRYLLTIVLAGGLLFGALMGSVFALNISRPIGEATRAVSRIAHGSTGETLRVQGPEEVRILQQTVNYLSQRLQELEYSRRRLLANLVHELGRPLGALRSAIQALDHGAWKDEQFRREMLTGMDDETSRLQRLLEELSMLYDRVLGSLELDLQEVPMSAWLTRQLSAWQHAAVEKNIDWQENIPPDLPPAQIDPDRLSQVVGNLLSNAVKYTPEGGRITITARAERDQMRISVSDTGRGIPIEEREKIFAPFYRGSHQGRFPQGMGLGLSIAMDLIKAHNGSLELEESDESGSTFTITVPIRQEIPSLP